MRNQTREQTRQTRQTGEPAARASANASTRRQGEEERQGGGGGEGGQVQFGHSLKRRLGEHRMQLLKNNLPHIKKCTMHANDFKLK